MSNRTLWMVFVGLLVVVMLTVDLVALVESRALKGRVDALEMEVWGCTQRR